MNEDSLSNLEQRIEQLEALASEGNPSPAEGIFAGMFDSAFTPALGAYNTLFGITLDETNSKVVVAARRFVLSRYGAAEYVWGAAETDITYASLAEGDNIIVMTFDPDDAASATAATIELSGSGEPVEEKLYTVTKTIDAGPPIVNTCEVTRIWRPGDVPIIALFGDHPVVTV